MGADGVLLLQVVLLLNLVLPAVVELDSVALLLLGMLQTLLGLLRVEGVLLLLVGDKGVTLDVEIVLVTGLSESNLVGILELGVRVVGGGVQHVAVDAEVLHVGFFLLIFPVDIPLVGHLVLAASGSDGVGVGLLLSTSQLGVDEGVKSISNLGVELPETVLHPEVGP